MTKTKGKTLNYLEKGGPATYFSTATMQARRQWSDITNLLKAPAAKLVTFRENALRSEGEVRSLLDTRIWEVSSLASLKDLQNRMK